MATDRRREALVRGLVALGWTVAELRAAGALRGDNAAIGLEVQAAREALGLEPAPSRVVTVGQERRPVPLKATVD